MLSWAPDSLLADGRSQSDIRQGVTLEVFGEGESYGPYTDALKAEMLKRQGDIRYEITWNSLGGFLETLERRGVACNVASFVGRGDRPGARRRVRRPRADARGAGPDARAGRPRHGRGALGVGSALIYAPGSYASTDELVALCEVAARHKGMYISHIRSEGDRLLEAVDELIEIARRAKIPAEIYHLKAAGRANWGKLDEALRKIEAARAEGLTDHGEHVSLYRRRHRARRRDAHLGAGRRPRRLDRPAEGPGHPRPGRPRDRRAGRRRGRTSTRPPARPRTSCSSRSRPTRSSR